MTTWLSAMISGRLPPSHGDARREVLRDESLHLVRQRVGIAGAIAFEVSPDRGAAVVVVDVAIEILGITRQRIEE